MNNELLLLFVKLHEELQSLKRKKHQQAKVYYHKHFGKETFRPIYYEELKNEFVLIEKLEHFFRFLMDDSLLLFTVLDCLKTAKEKRQEGQPLECIQLWLPLVPKVENIGNSFFVNLLNVKGSNNE